MILCNKISSKRSAQNKIPNSQSRETYVHTARGDLRPVLDQKALSWCNLARVQKMCGFQRVHKHINDKLAKTSQPHWLWLLFRIWEHKAYSSPDNADKCLSHNDQQISPRKCLHTSSYWNSECCLPLISFQWCFPSKRSSQSPLHGLSILITCHAEQTKSSSAFVETNKKLVIKSALNTLTPSKKPICGLWNHQAGTKPALPFEWRMSVSLKLVSRKKVLLTHLMCKCKCPIWRIGYQKMLKKLASFRIPPLKLFEMTFLDTWFRIRCQADWWPLKSRPPKDPAKHHI